MARRRELRERWAGLPNTHRIGRRSMLWLALCALLAGCNLNFRRELEGQAGGPVRARDLPAGLTVAQVLAQAGAPDLVVPAGEQPRLYYLRRTSSQVRIILYAFVPLGSNSLSPTVLVYRFGGAMLELARLDFDAQGALLPPEYAVVPVGLSDLSVGVDNRIVRTFYEDQRRRGQLRERGAEDLDDDDE